jgi:hypothetical protein
MVAWGAMQSKNSNLAFDLVVGYHCIPIIAKLNSK